MVGAGLRVDGPVRQPQGVVDALHAHLHVAERHDNQWISAIEHSIILAGFARPTSGAPSRGPCATSAEGGSCDARALAVSRGARCSSSTASYLATTTAGARCRRGL